MLKMFGAALVILAATLAGWVQARQFASRPNQIRRLILALKRLETEIMYGFTPLPDALRRIGEQSQEPVRAIFVTAADNMSASNRMSAQESLEQAAINVWKFTAMKAPEQEVIRQLSYTLGTSDRKDQLRHLATAVRQLESEESAAREEQARYEKMYRSLGLLCGAFIVILFY
ncbi:stage III sporulation protein SpoIIIAB [Paenibacillus macerans]|uniref:stage III sporulation protein SpoIIIAB n=1 Tax=Paenibacillus macerans TaxID=44252 RepID=UPI00203C0D6B|nr:stage III sporulation protein SpoIIIAB [Paenibacillus macerans]MCM3698302.1 stage III sporulation protein SpoIIIAB [Paenibacillus macerans]